MTDAAKSPDDRTTYLGGPGVATVLGVNPYQTPVALWMQLTGRAPPTEVNDAMRSGQRLERAVLDYAAEEIGREVLPGPFVRDVQLPIAAGHLDGITAGLPELVEAKTTRVRAGWGEPGTGEVPAHVAAQCEWYLGLMPALRVAWVPVLFSGLEFALYRVERDDQLIQRMRNIAWAWWRDHVVADIPPPPTSGADASLLFPKDTGEIVIADDATVEAVNRLRDVKRELGLLESEKDTLEGRVKLAMGDASILTIAGEQAATWKATKPSMRFDQSAFKDAHYDMYKEFCREQTSRRFLLKSTGE